MSGSSECEVLDVAVLGGGIVGLTAAALLRRAGMRFTVLEGGAEVGGTWRDHDYPGCGADTEASTYLPSFAPLLTRYRFPTRDELFEYCKDFAREHVGYENIRLRHRIESADFDSERGVWRITTQHGSVESRFVVLATFSGGSVEKVKKPSFKGQEDFEGKILHSSELGRDPGFFRGKRVGIVGCGASAIQIVPSIREAAETVTIFRRSMPYMQRIARSHGPRSLWAYRLQGARLRIRNEWISIFDGWPGLEWLYRWPYRLVEYGFRRPRLPGAAIPPRKQPVQCTRRGFDYLGFREALLTDDVELVDVSSGGLEGYYESGLIANGTRYACDVVVLATGYHMGEINFDIHVDGKTFDPVPENFIGMYGFVSGLPNAQVSVFGTPLWIIPPRTAEFNTKYLLRVIREAKRRGAASIEIDEAFAWKMTSQVRRMNRRHIVLSKHCPSHRYLLSNSEDERQGRQARKIETNLPYVPFPQVLMEMLTRVLFRLRHFEFRGTFGG